MPNVVNLRAFAQAKAEALETARSLQARMRSGELHSVLYIARGPGGIEEIGVAGDFVGDMVGAERAAIAGFEAMFGHPIGQSIQRRRALPRDLKKGT